MAESRHPSPPEVAFPFPRSEHSPASSPSEEPCSKSPARPSPQQRRIFPAFVPTNLSDHHRLRESRSSSDVEGLTTLVLHDPSSQTARRLHVLLRHMSRVPPAKAAAVESPVEGNPPPPGWVPGKTSSFLWSSAEQKSSPNIPRLFPPPYPPEIFSSPPSKRTNAERIM